MIGVDSLSVSHAADQGAAGAMSVYTMLHGDKDIFPLIDWYGFTLRGWMSRSYIGENVVPSGSMLVQVVICQSAIGSSAVMDREWTKLEAVTVYLQEIRYDRPDTEI
jgi:hypothetical protein